jgi:hypothetical protein
MRVEDTMTKLIRIVVAGLSLCGALALAPSGVAQARENDRPVAGHVERNPRGEHGREARRDHDRRGEHARGHEGRGRFEHGGARHPGCR